MKTLTKLIVPLLLGALAACGNPDAGPVTVSPKTVSVKAGDKTTLTATVEDAKESKVLWTVEGDDSHGTITSTGVYTAPTEAGTYTVVATNAVDTSKKDTASVTVLPAVVVAINPVTESVGTAGTTTLTAKVTGDKDTSVTWSVEGGEANGTITPAGVYTAPTTAGTYTVIATSVADPTRKGSVQVKVVAVSVAVKPGNQTLDQGATTTFTAELLGTSNTSVTWAVEGGEANGTITPAGVYTAPMKAGTYTVIATSVADPSKKVTATITVRAVTVSLMSAELTLSTAGSVAFYATVTGTTASSVVTWAVEGGEANGTITSAGVYTAPTTEGTYTVIATSVADPSRKATTQVIVKPVKVSIDPETTTLDQGATATFTANVTGTSFTAVTWSLVGSNTNGTITSTGIYTAPFKAGTYVVVATSVVDPSKKATATVHVRPVAVDVSPATVTLHQGASTTFTATVTGTTATTAVTWSAAGGSIDDSGHYTAPTAVGTYTVTATSVADSSKKATATITVPAAEGLAYADPTGTGWRLVKNSAESTANHLVLDLVGPSGQAGRGVDLTLSADATRASWAKVSAADAEHVTNRAFAIGTTPRLLKGTVSEDKLLVGVFQKGSATPATEYSSALVSVALELKPSPSLPSGALLPLALVKAHALSDSGTLSPIDVAVGTLTAE
jgi:hypothetical protein